MSAVHTVNASPASWQSGARVAPVVVAGDAGLMGEVSQCCTALRQWQWPCPWSDHRHRQVVGADARVAWRAKRVSYM